MLSFKFILISSISIIIANAITLFSKSLTTELITPSTHMLYIAGGFILVAALFLSSFGIVVLISEGNRDYIFYYLILLGTLAINLLINFQLTGSTEVLIDMVMILFSLLVVQMRFTKDMSNQIKISLSSISQNTGSFMLFTAIAISLNFYILNTKTEEGKDSYEKVKSYLYDTSSLYIERTIGTDTIKNSLPGIDIGNIYNKESTSEIIDKQEKVVETQVKTEVSNKIDSILDPYEPYFVPFSTILIFLSILSFTPIVRIFTIIIGNILFSLLKWFKLIEERVETVEVVRYRV